MKEELHTIALSDYAKLKKSLQGLLSLNKSAGSFEYKNYVITIKERYPNSNYFIKISNPVLGLVPGMKDNRTKTIVTVEMAPSQKSVGSYRGNIQAAEVEALVLDWMNITRDRRKVLKELEEVVEADTLEGTPEQILYNEFTQQTETLDPTKTLSSSSQQYLGFILDVVEKGVNEAEEFDSVSEDIIKQVEYIRKQIDSLPIKEIKEQLEGIGAKIQTKPEAWRDKLAGKIKDAIIKLAIGKAIELAAPVISHLLLASPSFLHFGGH